MIYMNNAINHEKKTGKGSYSRSDVQLIQSKYKSIFLVIKGSISPPLAHFIFVANQRARMMNTYGVIQRVTYFIQVRLVNDI